MESITKSFSVENKCAFNEVYDKVALRAKSYKMEIIFTIVPRISDKVPEMFDISAEVPDMPTYRHLARLKADDVLEFRTDLLNLLVSKHGVGPVAVMLHRYSFAPEAQYMLDTILDDLDSVIARYLEDDKDNEVTNKEDTEERAYYKQVNSDDLCSLSKHGYRLCLDEAQSQRSLYNAVVAYGKTKVLEKLRFLASVNAANRKIEQNIERHITHVKLHYV